MSNKYNYYKDEFGNFQEVDEEVETPLDGHEDDEQDLYEEDDQDEFEDNEESDYFDEDEAYLNEHQTQYDADED